MDNTISIQEWVQFIGAEYLESFIRDGGASVKFAVADDDTKNELAFALSEQSGNLGCSFVKINAVDARVHMPQDIFFAMAKQMDWRLLARRVVITLAERQDYRVADVALCGNDSIYAAIGDANRVDAATVMQELRPEIENRIFKNRRMARDFRVAMTRMCLLENAAPSDAYGGQSLVDWLTGTNTRIGNVKHFSVHTSINRTTARHFIESALYWIRYAGYDGVVILLDNTRVLLPQRPQDRSRFYTKSMVMDHYELLRELIDGTDRLSGALVVVVSNPDFLNEDTRSRGFGCYEALMTRVMNDVQDRYLANPMASLVRLS